MEKNTASIYLPKPETPAVQYNHVAAERTKGNLLSALKNAKTFKNYINVNVLSKNLTILSTSEFVQRYAVGAITKIINGEPVTNKTMLDSLFNTYAPALNCGLAQSGYNSLMEMKDAAMHGTINPANFLSELYEGLNAFTTKDNIFSYKDKYSEEIPIDVVEKCEYDYKTVVPEYAVSENENDTSYIGNMQRTVLKLHGHVKNKNAEMWDMNDFSYKIADAMSAKKMVGLRIGRTIYEDVIIANYKPVIENIYDIKFEMIIYVPYKKNQSSIPTKNRTVKIIPNKLRQDMKFLMAEPVYIGEGLVEKVTKKDVFLIEQVKKALGRDKILIDGEYV